MRRFVAALAGFLLAAVLTAAGPAPDAQANNSCQQFVGANDSTCADQALYPGVFTVHPAAPAGTYSWGSVSPAPAAGGTGGGDAGLAHTGGEHTSLAFLGAGLVGFGALALGSRRRAR